MKAAIQLASILLVCLTTAAQTAGQSDSRDLTVTQPLSQAEKTCAARLTRLRSARLWWNDDNRIIGVSLKGTDANNRAIALSSQLPGLLALVLVALPQNQLTDNGLAPLASHSKLGLLSISGDRLSDNALIHVQAISTLEVLVLNGNFTDAALEIISALPNLRTLDLTQSHITNAGLVHLPKLTNLETLILNGTDIRNESLLSITQLKKLTRLYLGDTALNDGAIEQLRNLEQLKLLFIKGTDITAEGVASLLPALPSTCKVVHDSGTYDGERVPQTAMARSSATKWQSAR